MMFRVTWEIDVDAETPLEAAEKAHEMQQRPTQATVFDVSDGRFSLTVDLLDEDGTRR